jgi:hypothetical protein
LAVALLPADALPSFTLVDALPPQSLPSRSCFVDVLVSSWWKLLPPQLHLPSLQSFALLSPAGPVALVVAEAHLSSMVLSLVYFVLNHFLCGSRAALWVFP